MDARYENSWLSQRNVFCDSIYRIKEIDGIEKGVIIMKNQIWVKNVFSAPENELQLCSIATHGYDLNEIVPENGQATAMMEKEFILNFTDPLIP